MSKQSFNKNKLFIETKEGKIEGYKPQEKYQSMKGRIKFEQC